MTTGLQIVLLEDLDSGVRSVRCEALRQLADIGLEEAAFHRVAALASDSQEDPEIRFLARQAILATECRRQTQAVAFPAFCDQTDLETQLWNLSPADFQRAMGCCSAESKPVLMDILRRRIPGETDSSRLAVILAAFRRWGSPEDAALLLPFLTAEDPLQVVEAIGALERLAPRVLFEQIDVPLASPLPTVQNRALRSILRFHFAKGVDELRRMFASDQASVRAAAVMQCLSIPFHKVRELIFNALALEEDAQVLARAAHLLYLNPGEQTVSWLMDIAGTASAAKEKWCRDCIAAVLESIRLSGIMEGSVGEFESRVRQQLESRQRSSLLGTLLEELHHQDPMRRYEAIETLREHRGLPEVQERFQALWMSDPDKRVKGLLTAIFAESPDRERLQAELAPERFPQLVREEQLALLGQVKSCEEFSFVRSSLQRFARMRLDSLVVAEVVRLLGRFGDVREDLPFLWMCLKSTDGRIQARAIEGIGRLAPESLLKELPRLIREQDLIARSAAMRTFFRLDKAQAMKALQEMLLSAGAAAKEQALLCLAQLSYSAVRPLLQRFVKEDANMTLVKKAGVILRNNPDPDTIRNLYGSLRLARGPRKAILTEIVQECTQSCIESGLIQGTVQSHLDQLRRDALAEELPTI